MDQATIISETEDIKGEVIRIRRHLHENPELSFYEKNTAHFIADHLRNLSIEVRTRVGGNGVVGLIPGKNPTRTIALRADMDALPVMEETGLPFSSKVSGVMHACGHDNHVAMLLGAASIISRHRDELKNNVKLIFQPAEEDGSIGGAMPMIEDGALENPKVNNVFGIHIMSNYPSGTFALRSGPIMAAPDHFHIKIRGKGGHGSAPDETIDPVFISAQVINALYGIRARYMSQSRPLVISVCMINAGTKDNIIPDELRMEGTIRTLEENMRSDVKKKITDIISQLVKSYGAESTIKFKDNAYPVTYNDPEQTDKVRKLLSEIKGAKVLDIDSIMGGEDVSRFLEKAPGTFYFLGTRNEKKGLIYPNHSSKFTSDEDVLPLGIMSLVMIAFNI